MGGIKVSVHPLFFLFGLYYAVSGRIFVFVIYTVCAVMHELGHSYAAANCGYRLNRITLMPFGAVVTGDLDGLKCGDELKIAFAGPLVNLATGLLFVASWWIYPEIYAYTDVVAEASFSLALVNFLPVFPLDGGRILSAVLSGRFGRKKSLKICRVISVIFAAALAAATVYSAFFTFNLSLLFFALFVIFGAFCRNKENSYVRIFSAVSPERLKKGLAVKTVAVDKSVTLKKLFNLLDADAVNEVLVFDNGVKKGKISDSRLTEIALSADLYSTIGDYVATE